MKPGTGALINNGYERNQLRKRMPLLYNLSGEMSNIVSVQIFTTGLSGKTQNLVTIVSDAPDLRNRQAWWFSNSSRREVIACSSFDSGYDANTGRKTRRERNCPTQVTLWQHRNKSGYLTMMKGRHTLSLIQGNKRKCNQSLLQRAEHALRELTTPPGNRRKEAETGQPRTEWRLEWLFELRLKARKSAWARRPHEVDSSDPRWLSGVAWMRKNYRFHELPKPPAERRKITITCAAIPHLMPCIINGQVRKHMVPQMCWQRHDDLKGLWKLAYCPQKASIWQCLAC